MRSSLDSLPRPTLWILLAAGLLFFAAGATAEQTVLVPYGLDCRASGGPEECCGCVAVCVPHDQAHLACGDQGPLYDSTRCD